jgi:hypothetical protein
MADQSLLEADLENNIYHSARNTSARKGDSAPQNHARPVLSLSGKLTEELQLRYYQYEVTFGLYVLTSWEKLVLNCIVVAIIGAAVYGLYAGLRPSLLHVLCRLVYYATGVAEASGALCAN